MNDIEKLSISISLDAYPDEHTHICHMINLTSFFDKNKINYQLKVLENILHEAISKVFRIGEGGWQEVSK